MSMKQLRAVIFDNGTPKAKEYGDKLFEEIGSTMETHQVNVYDTRPCTQVLPVRAIPNVAVLFYADTLEEGQAILEVAHRQDFPAITLGSRIIVPRDRFMAWIEEQAEKKFQ